VIVRTRHELVTLTAQVRAAGCETADTFQRSAARDVRSVLRDARSDVSTLSRDLPNPWLAWEEARRENGGPADDARRVVAAPGIRERLLACWRTAAVAWIKVVPSRQ
jgi:hypothetical protein